MNKALFLYAVAVTGVLYCSLRHYRHENRRLTQNQTALSSELRHYRTRAGEEAASVHALRLRCSEFERLRAADAARIRDLGVKLRRMESASTLAAQTRVTLHAPLRDSTPAVSAAAPSSGSTSPPVLKRPDTLRRFLWRDPWVTVSGELSRDSVTCRITSHDTLRQVVHRIPRRFLFIRWGTKALRQEIVSSNPHTRIVFSEHIRIER